MTDDSDLIQQLKAQTTNLEDKNEALSAQENTLGAISSDESATDAIIASFQAHVDSLLAARATTDATLNAANLKAEMRAAQLILTDYRNAIAAILSELRKHRQVLRAIKDNYAPPPSP